VEGEVDFLVMYPERGYLGLEVKGGEIGRDSDGWFSRDSAGTHRIKDPGKQAQRAVHAIRDFLKQRPWFRERQRWLGCGWGAVFPHVEVQSDLGPDLPRDLIIDRSDLTKISESLCRVFLAAGVEGPAVSPEAQQAFIDALAPRFMLVRSLASRVDEEWPLLVRLTEEQMTILDTLAEIPRIGVKGGAGTGKTLVAVEHARRLASAGQRILVLCYNAPLAEYLAARADGYTVKTFHAFCRDIIRAAGFGFTVPKDAAAARRFWDAEAPERLLSALGELPDERWDAIVIDEGQDFRACWWPPVERTLRDPKRGMLWVFFDPHQNVYGGGPTEALGLQTALLKWNCRNTAKIAQYAAAQVGIMPELKPCTPTGVDVEEIRCEGEHAMVDAVRTTLHRLITEQGLSPARVTVLSPRAEHSPIWRTKKVGEFTLVEYPRQPGAGEVSFASLQRFKGLEADAIVLCDVDPGKATCSPPHLYVGASRARHVLIVIIYAN
jgi:hypothetical protein